MSSGNYETNSWIEIEQITSEPELESRGGFPHSRSRCKFSVLSRLGSNAYWTLSIEELLWAKFPLPISSHSFSTASGSLGLISSSRSRCFGLSLLNLKRFEPAYKGIFGASSILTSLVIKALETYC